MMSGLFIVLEGPNGIGKTTLARHVLDRLAEHGIDAVGTAEPRDAGIGERIEGNPPADTLGAIEYALVFARDRLVNLYLGEDSIVKQLLAGRWVVQSRYYYSSIVYQGMMMGVPITRVAQLNWFAPPPHILVFLDRSGVDERERTYYELAYQHAAATRYDPSNPIAPDWARLVGIDASRLYPSGAKYPIVMKIDLDGVSPDEAAGAIVDGAIRLAERLKFLAAGAQHSPPG